MRLLPAVESEIVECLSVDPSTLLSPSLSSLLDANPPAFPVVEVLWFK